jgi:hypothetical protein
VADQNEQKTHTPFVPPSQVSPAELMKAFQDDGVIEPAKEAAPAVFSEKAVVSEKVAAPQPAEKSDEELPALVRLAREKDALRKERERAEPHLGLLKQFSPTEAQRLAAARANGDPVAALAALGFSHEQYTNKLLNLKDDEAPAEPKKPASDVDALRQEIQALKAEREQERISGARTQMLGQMKTILKDSPKFDHINKLEDYEGVEKTLIQYHSQYGELPGATMEESVTLAAEMYESQLRKEAARWSKVLTGFKESASTPVQKAPESKPSAGTVPARTTTLTNANTTAPAEVRTVPKTRAEIMAAIIEGRDDTLE